MVEEGKASASDFKFFTGYCGWGTEQWEGEVKQGTWFTGDFEEPDLAKLVFEHPEKSPQEDEGGDGGEPGWELVKTLSWCNVLASSEHDECAEAGRLFPVGNTEAWVMEVDALLRFAMGVTVSDPD
jgi:hypothetical protein